MDGDRHQVVARFAAMANRRTFTPVAALVVAVVLVVVSAQVPVGHAARSLDALAYVLIAVSGGLVVASGRRPRLVAGLATAVLCLFVIRDYPAGPVWLVGPVSLAVLSWRTDRRTAVAGAGAMFAALTAAVVVAGQLSLSLPLVFLGWSGAAALFGDVFRARAERAQILERGRQQELATRMAEERLRIARDLHDSVAHAMATINVQAGAAGHVLARQPEAAAEALNAIQQASADVLLELGHMLALLRNDTEDVERAPAPGVRDVPRLVDSVAAAGVVVTLKMEAAPREVASAVGTAIYRVVQESLTNVLRHSQARSARVEIDVAPRHVVRVSVSDPGPIREQGAAGLGVGLRGMEERVRATGGHLTTGTTPDGGFAVRAEWGRDR